MKAVPLTGDECKREVLRVKIRISESRVAWLRESGQDASEWEASIVQLRARLASL